MTAKSLTGLHPTTSDAGRDTMCSPGATAAGAIVSLVRVEFVGVSLWTASLTVPYALYGVHGSFEVA
jgi:hypothetical protein